MAVIGYLGEAANTGVIFEVSDETVETVRNMVWSGSARYAVHQRHMNHALTEFTGLDPDKISFDITLAADLGVEPMEELVKLWTFKRQGTALQLLLGEHGYGKYRWNLTSLKTKVEHTDVHGDVFWCTVSVSLLECLSAYF